MTTLGLSFVAQLIQEFDRLGRDPGIGQKPHRDSGADGVHLVLDQGGGEASACRMSASSGSGLQNILLSLHVKVILSPQPMRLPQDFGDLTPPPYPIARRSLR